MSKIVTNVAASVRAKLEDVAKTRKQPFQEVLQYYGIERTLYRLSCSHHSKSFVLKGAIMLRVWDIAESRPTRDIDFLGSTNNEVNHIVDIFRELCSQEVENDGLIFNLDTIQGERITEDADYAGVRVTYDGNLGRTKIPMQVDIGFSDTVYPKPVMVTYPAILPSPQFELLAYTMESVIAEKLEAITKLGLLNSRLKDFFDIWVLSRKFQFRAETLSAAIRQTFHARNTNINPNLVAFNETFYQNSDKLTQWGAFQRRIPALISVPLQQIINDLNHFLRPILRSISEEESQVLVIWDPGYGWRENT